MSPTVHRRTGKATKGFVRVSFVGTIPVCWATCIIGLLLIPGFSAEPKPYTPLTPTAASSFARLALRCVEKEYPNKLDHIMTGAADVQGPRALHPSFYGCFDWHSSVHGHWMLARLLRLFPELPDAPQIRRVFEVNLAPEKIAAEVSYLEQPAHRTFERTYGWAWLLKLSAELHSSAEPDFRRWAANLDPLAKAIVARYRDFLPRQTYPIRTGVHPNTAFGIALALDYAETVCDPDFESFLKTRANYYFGRDQGYAGTWEPGGEDFLSPALMEAELMRRVRGRRDFAQWFRRFLPDFDSQTHQNLLRPAIVSDRTDPKLVHLDGLNLSRAWCMQGIARDLPGYSTARKLLRDSAAAHLAATLPHITSGNYEGEHWLASFAVLATTEPRSPGTETSAPSR